MSRLKLPRDTEKFISLVEKNDFRLDRTRGSHFIFVNKYTNKHITVTKKMNQMIIKRLIKENGLV